VKGFLKTTYLSCVQSKRKGRAHVPTKKVNGGGGWVGRATNKISPSDKESDPPIHRGG